MHLGIIKVIINKMGKASPGLKFCFHMVFTGMYGFIIICTILKLCLYYII